MRLNPIVAGIRAHYGYVNTWRPHASRLVWWRGRR